MNLKVQPAISTPEYKMLLKHDFRSFLEASFRELNPDTKFIPGYHIDLIASKLEACMRGEIKRLIINLPPRNLKSHCISIAFPAWLLGHQPSSRVICASYGQDLADKLARDTRTLMGCSWYKRVFPTRIADRQAVHDFETTDMGGRMATSVGGVLTGRGADFIILDDPQKPDEALSEAQRKSVIDWFQNTLLSRLNDKAMGCIIIVMQRLHEDDLVGHVLQEGGWEVLFFPAIAEENTSYTISNHLGRKTVDWPQGTALHPERESLETLERIRRQIGEYNFSSQYQQKPIPPGGAIIKRDWLKYYEPGSQPPRFQMIVQSWDTANKAGELNDYSVCTTWGVMRDNYYLLHVYRARLTFPDLKRKVAELKQQWRANFALVEDKASGIQLIQELKSTGLNVKAYEPSCRTDKEIRLHAQSAAFENGRVLLPTEAPWLRDYVAEITGFPGTKFDDQVDSTTQFLDYMSNRPRGFNITPEMLRRASIPTCRSGFYRSMYGPPF